MSDHLPDELNETQNRKLEHLDIVLNKNTQYREKTTMFEHMKVLPHGKRIKEDEVETGTSLLKREIAAPIFVSGMTGGHEITFKINRNIAIAVSRLNLPMGVGSQRAMMEKKDLTYSYAIKKFAKDIILIGNMGASRLKMYGNSEIQEMLDSIDADMLAIHTNPGQESVQPEGDIDFRGVYDRIIEVAGSVRQPTIVKEVGNGISKEVARMLKGKVWGIDVQGAGGTTWIGVETYRNRGADSAVFWDWGIPTALSVMETRSTFDGAVWASGGIRKPSDILKALAIGASMCGIAQPIIASEKKGGSEGVYTYLSSMINGLRAEMAGLGIRSIAELREARVVLEEPLSSIVKQRKIKLQKNVSSG
jgi:isopentenyl-diphosphate delta-isomerase